MEYPAYNEFEQCACELIAGLYSKRSTVLPPFFFFTKGRYQQIDDEEEVKFRRIVGVLAHNYYGSKGDVYDYVGTLAYLNGKNK